MTWAALKRDKLDLLITDISRIYKNWHGTLYKDVIVSHELYYAFLYCNSKIEELRLSFKTSENTENEIVLTELIIKQIKLQSLRAQAAEELSKRLQPNCIAFNIQLQTDTVHFELDQVELIERYVHITDMIDQLNKLFLKYQDTMKNEILFNIPLEQYVKKYLEENHVWTRLYKCWPHMLNQTRELCEKFSYDRRCDRLFNDCEYINEDDSITLRPYTSTMLSYISTSVQKKITQLQNITTINTINLITTTTTSTTTSISTTQSVIKTLQISKSIKKLNKMNFTTLTATAEQTPSPPITTTTNNSMYNTYNIITTITTHNMITTITTITTNTTSIITERNNSQVTNKFNKVTNEMLKSLRRNKRKKDLHYQ